MVPPPRQQVIAALAVLCLLLTVIGLHRYRGNGGGKEGATRQTTWQAVGGAEAGARGPGGNATGADENAPGGIVGADTPVVVDVAGAVRNPGVYTLAASKRIYDALRAAGGPLLAADLSAINRAAVLVDGQQILVPTKNAAGSLGGASGSVMGGTGAAGPGSAGGGGGAAISLNNASLEQLDTLPGIGPAMAQRIIDDRTQNGPFRSIEDLERVPGFGSARIETLRPAVSL